MWKTIILFALSILANPQGLREVIEAARLRGEVTDDEAASYQAQLERDFASDAYKTDAQLASDRTGVAAMENDGAPPAPVAPATPDAVDGASA